MKYQGLSPELVNEPHDPGLLKQGGADVTEVAAGTTPQATAVTELVPEIDPPDVAGAAAGKRSTDRRRAAATAAALLACTALSGNIGPSRFREPAC